MAENDLVRRVYPAITARGLALAGAPWSLPNEVTEMVTATRPNLLSTEEAAEYIGVQPQTLALWRSTGRYKIPYLKIGRLVKYRQSDLDTWLSTREATHTSEIA